MVPVISPACCGVRSKSTLFSVPALTLPMYWVETETPRFSPEMEASRLATGLRPLLTTLRVMEVVSPR